MRNKHPVSGNTKKKSGRGNSPAAFLRGALLAAVAGLLACAVLTAVAAQAAADAAAAAQQVAQ